MRRVPFLARRCRRWKSNSALVAPLKNAHGLQIDGCSTAPALPAMMCFPLMRFCGAAASHTPEAARVAGLGGRQFGRRFVQQVGMRPKLYARIARFEAALDGKARSPTKPWSDVAHEFGYHDQMHLVHDFREFAGETPTTVLTHVERSSCADQATRRGRAPKRPRRAATEHGIVQPRERGSGSDRSVGRTGGSGSR